KVARWAYEDVRPLFGIWRGNQEFNVALGGTLIQDIPSTQPSSPLTHDRDDLNFALLSHEIDVKPESRLASILTQPTVKVNSLHHQAVLELAPVLKVNARASDGVVE